MFDKKEMWVLLVEMLPDCCGSWQCDGTKLSVVSSQKLSYINSENKQPFLLNVIAMTMSRIQYTIKVSERRENKKEWAGHRKRWNESTSCAIYSLGYRKLINKINVRCLDIRYIWHIRVPCAMLCLCVLLLSVWWHLSRKPNVENGKKERNNQTTRPNRTQLELVIVYEP